MMMDPKKNRSKLPIKKKKVSHHSINAYITCTHNNTKFVATTKVGNVITWTSPGVLKFSGTKRSTPHSASEAALDFIERIKAFDVKEIVLMLKGLSPGREAALRAIAGANLPVKAIYDITPVPHGGCRRPGRRRV